MRRLLPWQVPAVDLPGRTWDVVVVGAGPAGATTALHLARRGRSVCLLERHAFPRDKTCGDLLIPDSIGALRRSGLLEAVWSVAHPSTSALVSSPGRIDWTMGGEYLAVKRIDLDTIVARGAAEAGAHVAQGRVAALEPHETGVVVTLSDGSTVAAHIGVLATGADVSLLEGLGMLSRKEPSSFAARRYVRSRAAIEPVVVAFDRAVIPGYGWIFPMRSGEFNVGVGRIATANSDRNLRELFDSFVEDFPLARDLMARSTEAGELKGARLRCGLEGAALTSHGRILAVGETIGTTFPFTGEGIGKAMESGEIAADVIDDALRKGLDRLSRYPGRIDDSLGPKYYGYRVAERWLARPHLGDLLAWRIKRSRFLRDAAEGIIAETTDPRELFSFRGLVRSFLN